MLTTFDKLYSYLRDPNKKDKCLEAIEKKAQLQPGSRTDSKLKANEESLICSEIERNKISPSKIYNFCKKNKRLPCRYLFDSLYKRELIDPEEEIQNCKKGDCYTLAKLISYQHSDDFINNAILSEVSVKPEREGEEYMRNCLRNKNKKIDCLDIIEKEIGYYHIGALQLDHDILDKNYRPYRRFIPRSSFDEFLEGRIKNNDQFVEFLREYQRFPNEIVSKKGEYLGKAQKIDLRRECLWEEHGNACDFLAEKFSKSYVSPESIKSLKDITRAKK